MPNTVVKLINAESTWLEAAWEDRKLLIKKERDTQKCVSLFVVSAREEERQRRRIPAWEWRGDYGNGFCLSGARNRFSYRFESRKIKIGCIPVIFIFVSLFC